MSTSRPFAYNPSQVNISDTYNIGTMCVGIGSQFYINNYGGLTWWNGPDEDLGYCIGTVVPAQNQSTPLGDIGNVQFWRTQAFTDSAFLTLVKEVTGQSFVNVIDAIFYLDNNSYWTSYPANRFYFVVSNRCSVPKGFSHIKFGKVKPNSTPAYRLYLKPGPLNMGVNNYTLIATDSYGSPPKNASSVNNSGQYNYGQHAWLTDVNVLKVGSSIICTFPNGGTTTYGTTVYQNIVLPYT